MMLRYIARFQVLFCIPALLLVACTTQPQTVTVTLPAATRTSAPTVAPAATIPPAATVQILIPAAQSAGESTPQPAYPAPQANPEPAYPAPQANPEPTSAPQPERPLPTIALKVGDQTLTVELAATNEQRQRGLMFRKEMPENAGMLFVFPDDRQLSFWMHNTLIPLSIAYIDSKGVILNIEDMQPMTDDTHASAGLSRYALEVNQGWFAKHGITAGAKVEFSLPADLDVS